MSSTEQASRCAHAPARRFACIPAAAAVLLAALPAWADSVGSAVAVVPAAQRETSGGPTILARGAEVNAFDRVRTSVDGAVTLRFKDGSTLEVGPGSLVSIDKFVYNADNTAAVASLTMARGAFRWASGSSRKEAYDLKTPAATLGVRGTEFAVVIDPDSTSVQLQHGAVRACHPASGSCREITRAGQGLRLWNTGRVEAFVPGSPQHHHIGRMMHHMRQLGLPAQPPGQQMQAAQQSTSGTQKQQAATSASARASPATGTKATPAGADQIKPRSVPQTWTGSYVPSGGLVASMKTPQEVDRMPVLSTSGPGRATGQRAQGAFIAPPARPQGLNAAQGGSGSGVNPMMAPGGPLAHPRLQMPGAVERKSGTTLSITQ